MSEITQHIKGAIMCAADGRLTEREMDSIVPEIEKHVRACVNHTVGIKNLKFTGE